MQSLRFYIGREIANINSTPTIHGLQYTYMHCYALILLVYVRIYLLSCGKKPELESYVDIHDLQVFGK